MNAIILSREDTDDIYKYAPYKFKYILTNGTLGYSWLSVVPDEVLHVIQGGDCSDDIFQQVSKEIYCRENLKPPRIDTH